MPESKTKRDVVQEVMLTLGHGLVDVDLKKEHINYAIKFAINVYRQRASNATAETGTIFKYKKFVQKYDLSDTDIVDIKDIKRNTLGSSAAADYSQDPFLMMYTNQMMGALNQNMTYGSISTVHIQHSYIKTLEQIVAGRIDYAWNPSTKVLQIFNKIARDEVFLLVSETQRSEDELLNDTYVRPWVVLYAVAKSKAILGEARSKFQTLAGPNGGVTLNGNELKQEAQQEMEKLEEQLQSSVTDDEGYNIYFG